MHNVHYTAVSVFHHVSERHFHQHATKSHLSVMSFPPKMDGLITYEWRLKANECLVMKKHASLHTLPQISGTARQMMY